MGKEDELLRKADEPNRLSAKYHQQYMGKMETTPKCIIRSFNDFNIWYSPGVAEVCKIIKNYPEKVFDYTNKGNIIAIVNDGTRVLGLGNIGPEAGLPVMEGKALLFKYLGGVDAIPLSINTTNADEIINFCKWIEPSFGGINLEDIEKPKCFYILEQLVKESNIPVWHDDQQGTATVVVSGVINSLKVVDKKIDQIDVSLIGSGAANINIAKLLIAAGVNPKKILMVDSKGILNKHREELQNDSKKWEICLKTNVDDKSGGIKDAMKNTDLCVAMSSSVPGTIKKEWVSSMQNDSIIFACANPLPEIWPWDALEAGARIVATGRSDFPNQINNSLVFPGVFRGVLDVRSTKITDEMCIAAAFEIAKVAEDKGINEKYIVPTMDEWEVFIREAVVVGMKAIEQGHSRIKRSKQELQDMSRKTIKRSRDIVQTLMKEKHIQPAPE